jgi:hypothetical protein
MRNLKGVAGPSADQLDDKNSEKYRHEVARPLKRRAEIVGSFKGVVRVWTRQPFGLDQSIA